MSEDNDPDQFIAAVGQIGRWQLRMFLFGGLCLLPASFPVLSMTFMNINPEPICGRPQGLRDKFTLAEWKGMTDDDVCGQNGPSFKQEL